MIVFYLLDACFMFYIHSLGIVRMHNNHFESDTCLQVARPNALPFSHLLFSG